MPVVNLNFLTTYMENNDASLEQALEAYGVEELDEAARKELERQVQLHQENINNDESGAQPTQGETPTEADTGENYRD